MRRTTRKALVHFSLFITVLSLVIYLNRPNQTLKTFSWNEVRYKTTSTKLPATHGICPSLRDDSKPALVVSRISSDDSKWLDDLSQKYHLCIYTNDILLDPTSQYLQVPANRGHEAITYLTFLIDNYAQIPKAGVVFIHGSRWAWHNDHPDYDNLALLQTLNISSALAPWGYHNLRCDWSLSTCSNEEPAQGSLETSMQAVLSPWDARAVSDAALPGALESLFGGGESSSVLLGRDDAVRSQCCAQFTVSRDSIWQHSLHEYVALRQWLLDSGPKAAPPDDRAAGRILSYVWHILFMRRSVSNVPGGDERVDLERLNGLACPRAEECYCRLYGRCGLKNCLTDGNCFGQYRLPADLKLPDDWAATHS